MKWCFWTVVLDKTLESPLNFKEIQPVHPKMKSVWISIGRTDVETETPMLWPPDVKNRLFGKDWRQEEKGMTEDEVVGWNHWLNGHAFEHTMGAGDGQESLACCSPRGWQWLRRLSDWTKVNWNEISSELVKLLSCVWLFATPWTTRLLCPWNFLGKSTGVGCHFLLQGIFPTQEWNLGLLHCRQILYHLRHQGSPFPAKFRVSSRRLNFWDVYLE